MSALNHWLNEERLALRGKISMTKKMTTAVFTLMVVAVILICGTAHAQTVSATLVGTVTDKTGAVTPRAKIVILETHTGISKEATTNDSGNYTFADLSPGSYSITAELQGFRKEVRAQVDVIVNTTTRVDLTLTPGSVSDTITVTDESPLLQTDRGDVNTKIETEKLENLPLGTNRNFQNLLNLVPGTTPASFQHSQFFNAGSSLQTQVNGLPRTGNNYEIEGIDDNERSGLLQVMIPPADAIETVDVSTNNYEPELGRGFGGAVNVTLKSGTNKFHGSLSEYLQNNFFNARSYFQSAVGHVAYNYYGGNISGPIFKDKLFFYFDYFRNADHEGTATTITIPYGPGSQPGAALDWSGVCAGGVGAGASGFVDLSAGLNYAGNGKGQVYDPATGTQTGSTTTNGPTSTGYGRVPFTNNQLPCSRVNKSSLAFFKGLPKANQNVTSANLAAPTNNYFALLPFVKSQNTYDTKIDYQLTPKDRLSFRYGYQSSTTLQAPVFAPQFGGDSPGGGFAGSGKQNAFSTAVNYNRAFTSKLLTEVRFGVAHYRNDAQPSDYNSPDATNIGIPGVNINPFSSGQVNINLGSFSQPTFGYSASLPWVRAETNIDFVNHWTYVAGNHTLKAGFDLRRIRDALQQGQTYSPRGLYSFGNSQTNIPGPDNSNFSNAEASFLLDLPSSAGRDLVTYFPELRQWYIFGFLSDKWQVTPKLTLDLGVRYEVYPPPTPRKAAGFSNYDPATNTLIVAGVGGNPLDMGLAKHYGNLGPRFGFAYRLNEGTVVRGGFGVSYSPFQDNTYAYNYPVKANNAFTTSAAQNGFAAAVLADGVTYATFVAGFPAPVPVAVPANGIINVSSNATLNSSSFITVPHSFQNAYAEMYNVMVQQALPGNFSLQLGFVGNHAVHLGSTNDHNLPSVLGGGNASRPQFATFGRTASANYYFDGVSSNYSSLQVLLTRRFAKGLSSSSAFTWGKDLGYIGNGDEGGYYFYQDRAFSYGAPNWDRRLNYQQSFTYELPFGVGKRFLNHGFAAETIGGWKLAAIVGITSGSPFTVGYSGTTLNTPGWNQTANLVGSFKKLGGGPGHLWFDPAAFPKTAQPIGCTGAYVYPNCPEIKGVTVGNTKYNNFYGPGFVQNNVSIFKTFGIFERATMDVRMDVFQLTNTPQFSGLDTGINDANFGQITGTLGSGNTGGVNGIGGGRALQLAAIIKF